MEKTMEKIVALAKARGFVYPGSESASIQTYHRCALYIHLSGYALWRRSDKGVLRGLAA